MFRFGFILAFGSLVFGQQLDTNSVTVTASRSTSLQADQVSLLIRVDSSLTATLSDVLTTVQGAGLTLSNFSSVGTQSYYSPVSQQNQPTLEWTFGLAVPLTKMKETLAMLTRLQQAVAQAKNGMTLSFYVQGTQVSQQAQQSQNCVIGDLLADARAQAQKLADAGGRLLGSILALSSTTTKTLDTTSNRIPNYMTPTPCSLTVKFALNGL